MSTETTPAATSPTPTTEAAPSNAKDEGTIANEAPEGAATGRTPTLPTEPNAVDNARISMEIIELEAESVRPPPPVSLRPKSAKDSTTPPLAITAQLPAREWPPKTVADLMTRKIITVAEVDPIGKLEECMQRFHFRHLPVVDANRKLVGLISRTDLLHAELGRKPDGSDGPKVDSATLAQNLMRRGVVVAKLDTLLTTASSVMLKNQIRCLPVVLEDHTLVGIVTETDFVRCTRDLLNGRPGPE